MGDNPGDDDHEDLKSGVPDHIKARAEERPHPGPRTVHRRGSIRGLQERLYPQRGIHLMSTAEFCPTTAQHQ